MCDCLNETEEALMMLIIKHKFPVWYKEAERNNAIRGAAERGDQGGSIGGDTTGSNSRVKTKGRRKKGAEDEVEQQILQDVETFDEYGKSFTKCRRMSACRDLWDDMVIDHWKNFLREKSKKKAAISSEEDLDKTVEGVVQPESPGLLRRLAGIQEYAV